MKKQLSCLLSLALFAAAPTFAASISQADQDAISKSVSQMAHALENHDASVLADQTFDYAIKEAGGRDAYIKVIETSFQSLDAKHYRMLSYVPQIPQDSVDAGPYDVCVIKQQLAFVLDAQTYRVDSFVLGIRKKNDKNWKYLDGAGISKHPEMLKKILPSLPDTFRIPDSSVTLDGGTYKPANS
jgi:hypothetical protein